VITGNAKNKISKTATLLDCYTWWAKTS